jgi:putative ABC transport system permease protein
MNPIWKIAVRNVKKNWRHSLAAMLSIVAGVLALTSFEGYMADLRRVMEDAFSSRQMLGDVIIEKRGAAHAARGEDWRYQIGPGAQAFIDQFLADPANGVVKRVRFLNVAGLVTNGRTSSIFTGFGYDVAEGERMREPNWRWNAVAGAPLDTHNPDALVVGKRLGMMLNCGIGSEVGVRGDKKVFALSCPNDRLQLSATTDGGQLNAIEPKLVGLLDAGLKELDARFAMLPLPAAQRLLHTEDISMYSVKLASPNSSDEFSRRLRLAADGRGVALDVTPWKKHRAGELFRRSIDLIGLFRTFICAVVMAIAGMSVLNAFVKAVNERTREIGTLRTLGFGRKQIVLLFAIEGALLALLATLAGLALSFALASGVNHARFMYKAGILAEPIPMTVSITLEACLEAVAVLGAIAIVAAIVPARRAAAAKIADALGHV